MFFNHISMHAVFIYVCMKHIPYPALFEHVQKGHNAKKYVHYVISWTQGEIPTETTTKWSTLESQLCCCTCSAFFQRLHVQAHTPLFL